MRSDAVANRAKVVAAATVAFAEQGVDAPLDDIARIAGVGPGTVHRHFRTKADLVDAVLAQTVTDVLSVARERASASKPGEALREFLEQLVVGGAEAHELSDRLGGSAGEVGRAVADLDRELARLVSGAKDVGAVSPELSQDTLSAVIAAGHAAYTHRSGGHAALSVVLDGLFVATE